jgi:hypothetical protein
MLVFLKANIATIIVLLVVIAAVALAVYSIIKNKKAGKSSCGCNCSGCPNAGSCHLSQERK